MNNDDAYYAFLELAEDLFINGESKRDLARLTAQLPPITDTLLKQLGNHTEEIATHQPRYGWAVANVAYRATVEQKQDVYLQSLAAWYLGRASNHWGQPKLVKQAISKARQGFLKLNQTGWVAACDWQYYILSWARPDIPHAVVTLQHAVEKLRQTGFEDFVPHCRLALAYAQLLIGKFGSARNNIRNSEVIFIANRDHLNQARCWLHEASRLRRKDQIDQALNWLQRALTVFEHEDSPIDIAKAHYQLGLCHLIWAEDLTTATNHFQRAIELFAGRDMDLWQAQCVNNLGFVYLLTGLLGKANASFEQARKSFKRHEVLGLLADNLNDNGKLNNLRGLSAISIEQFKQAMQINEQLGLKLSEAIDMANLGEAYGLVGRYQDALHHLEQAVERFRLLKNFTYLSSAEKFEAIIWSHLGQPAVALNHIDQAMSYYQASNKKGSLASFYNYHASILFKQHETDKARTYLEMSLNDALSHGMQPQAALARRLLGEALFQLGENVRALDYLGQAQADFVKMGMTIEQAATLVSIGTCYASIQDTDKAKDAFEAALQLSESTMPEIDWRACAGLANLAEDQGNIHAEFRSYRYALNALAKIRRNFWQPELAGSYLQTPATFLDRAIRRAAEAQASQDALQFVEQNKATTSLAQLESKAFPAKSKKSQELINLTSEIRWLQDRLRVSFDSTNIIKTADQTRQRRAQLIEKMRMYDRAMSRLERQHYSNETYADLPDSFSLLIFRELANQALGKSWLALDYYMLEEALITVVITPAHCEVYGSPLTGRIAMALEMSTKNQYFAQLSQKDLCILGDFLVPSTVSEFLGSDTYLLIAPHKRLHGIPWSALQPSFTSQPLVYNCILSVVPSLHSLCTIWKRHELTPASRPQAGLVVGVSDFQGTKEKLPYVKLEVDALRAKLDLNSKFLVESDATWEKLKRLKTSDRKRGQGDHSRFHWLHIATHFFVDPHTGRLSGFNLWDSVVWLDQLRDLVPLPGLMTFSACNSILSFVYEGDEHMDLPTTCFTGGANTVVGSLWPILDESAAQFTISFYDHYWRGLGPARAVNEAQKRMIARGEKASTWASFVCMGAP